MPASCCWASLILLLKAPVTEILNIASQVSASVNYVQIPQVVNTFAICVGLEKAVTKKQRQ